MTLFKLSLKNIKKSIKDYTIYFFTLILGVAVFYIFNAIETQTVMLDVSKSTYEVIDMMNDILAGVSVFISIILGFLIIYASRFLMKRRKREFGVYLLLGMSKRKISFILFVETFCIGLFSLGIGLGIGVCLSQLMSVLISNMFEADMTKFEFVFSTTACIKTLLYFSVMYLLVMVFNTGSVNACKLIDLISSNRKPEKIKLKNPWICIFIFLIASIMLGYAYYLVTAGIENMMSADKIIIPIALGTVSTFLVFWSLSGLLLKILMSRKKLYYKGLNSFTLRQVSSKINTMVFSMTIICLMLFMTICTLSSSLSMKNSISADLKNSTPVDIQLQKKMNLNEKDIEKYGYTKEQIEDSKASVLESLDHIGFDTNAYFKDVLDFYLYTSDEILLSDTLGEVLPSILEEYPMLSTSSKESFMKMSDYNKMAVRYGLTPVTLKDNEYVIVANYELWTDFRNRALQMHTSIYLNGKKYVPKYETCMEGYIFMSGSRVNIGFIVVPDDALSDSMRSSNVLIADYNANTKQQKHEIEEKIVGLNKEPYVKMTTIGATSKISLYEASIGISAMVTFIGLYLGIIFLITSAAVLALKELSESTDNKERFMMLRKLGADEKMINKALFRQIAIFFMFPLALAILHSVFGIMFCNHILYAMGNKNVLQSIILTAIFLILIYGGYFIITFVSSKNIIRER